MTAKRLQSKLFGAVKDAVNPGRSASPTEDTPPGSGTSTPVPGGDGLKIDIPSTPSSASKGAKNLPKRPPAVAVPSSQPQQTSTPAAQPAAAAEATGTPLAAPTAVPAAAAAASASTSKRAPPPGRISTPVGGTPVAIPTPPQTQPQAQAQPSVATPSATPLAKPPALESFPQPPGATPAGTTPPANKPASIGADDKTPPAVGNPSPVPGSDPGTPRERKTLRSRLQKELGSRYRTVEEYRLDQSDAYEVHWKRWGPYLSERQWGTVREDYSANGDAWNSFPFDMAKSRAYRWGEDGMAGISDNHQRLCFSLALWNGKDPILKERLFGLTGEQGNHGEDVKELYYYLDSTPTHSYMKYLYKYPQNEYPYEKLKEENRKRSREEPEYELMDTGVFDEDRYWDVFVEYAKDEEDPNSYSIRITAYNRGPDPADLHILPHLFFRNTWSWPKEIPKDKPYMNEVAEGVVEATHPDFTTRLYCLPSPAPAAPTRGGVVLVDGPSVVPTLLFTENETNFKRLYNGNNRTPYNKDAFHDYVIPSHRPKPETPAQQEAEDKARQEAEAKAAEAAEAATNGAANGSDAPAAPAEPACYPAEHFVNPEKTGTKAAAHYVFNQVPGRGGCVVVRLKLTPNSPSEDPAILDEEMFDDTIEERRIDADEFYSRLSANHLGDDLRNIMRQALAGMLWTKQYYQFIQKEWIEGDPGQPPPPPERKWVRNREWRHLYINDILSMPDKWEYPWFATWDTAFHCIPLAMVDPSFAKKQLDLMTREWYMKPDGALPAYEWNFSDTNPPVHCWATLRVFKLERRWFGREDLDFLERVFQKLLLNFTWWVNRKDSDGANVFEGGFLGLDNIGPFNRSEPLPTGGSLRQADGTSWMAFYSLNMLSVALELAKHNPTYEDIASKFFEHFLYIADAMTYPAGNEQHLSLWDDNVGLYFDAIQWGFGHAQLLPVRSMVSLTPLYGTLVIEPGVLKRFPGFKKRLDWFIANRPDISGRNVANMKARGRGDRLLLALASKERLTRILEKMLDEDEFLSDYGVRSMSRYHKDHPFEMEVGGQTVSVGYWPGDSRSGMFGGNSNWRGPIWLAVNLLLIESLQRFHQFYGDEIQVECPVGSGDYMNLAGCAQEITHRLIHIFGRDTEGRRAVNGGNDKLDHDPNFRDYLQYYEFFEGDTGAGLGASHQTGWTGLVAYLIQRTGEFCRLPKTPKTPRSIQRHYFDEVLNTPYTATTSASEWGDDSQPPYSAYTEHSEWDEPEPDEL